MTRNDTTGLPTVTALKTQAKRLRDTLASQGTPLTHSASLELLARQHGYRDWNTLRAAADAVIPNRQQAPVLPGDRVSGHYLGQQFSGEVIGARQMTDQAHWRITLKFDTPVDVVKFDSFSALRSRVNATIDARGVSPQRTSDGEPQLRLAL